MRGNIQRLVGILLELIRSELRCEAGWMRLNAAVRAWLVVGVVAGLSTGFAYGAAATLRDQIRELAAVHGFSVSGLGRLGEAPSKRVEGGLRQQLDQLLDQFNYVLVGSAEGGVDKLIVSSAKRSSSAAAPVAAVAPAAPVASSGGVSTTRRGHHHVVSAVLEGPAGASRSVDLMIDTGASILVLPTSMIRSLGFREADLRDTWSQTANGKVRMRRGRLASVRVGQALVKDVSVGFIDDEALGENRLLGMSFLRRFRFTIDDEKGVLLLMSK